MKASNKNSKFLKGIQSVTPLKLDLVLSLTSSFFFLSPSPNCKILLLLGNKFQSLIVSCQSIECYQANRISNFILVKHYFYFAQVGEKTWDL
jgi:hypothetical protein